MENSKTQVNIPEPDWYKKHRDNDWDAPPWEQSTHYQEAIADYLANNLQPEETSVDALQEATEISADILASEEPATEVVSLTAEPIVSSELKVGEDDVALEIPMNRIRHLVERDEVVSIKVHGKPLLVNKAVLCEIAGNVPFEKINMKSVQEALETALSTSEVGELRKTQTRSVSLGSEYHLVKGEPVLDMSQFKVRTPSLATKLKVEIADQDFDIEGFALLNGVKPEFKDIAKGLERVVKTPVAAHILNIIQEQDPKQEMAFYAMLFDRLAPEANTFTLALGMMRHLMQYALNVDSLELRSILTEEFLNKGGTE